MRRVFVDFNRDFEEFQTWFNVSVELLLKVADASETATLKFDRKRRIKKWRQLIWNNKFFIYYHLFETINSFHSSGAKSSKLFAKIFCLNQFVETK